jgi:beta-lactamase regulating signal transducer with metallopeptidase domain
MIDGLTFDVAARAVGAALLHSLWQGSVAALLTMLALRLLRGASAQARYLVACAGLSAMLVAFSITAARNVEGGLQTALADLQTALGAAPSTPAAPLLGPGPLDFSSAVRELAPSALDEVAALPSWPARLERWSTGAVPLWFAGVVLLSLRMWVGWRALEGLRRTHVTPVASDLAARMLALAVRVGVSRPVQVAQSAAVHVPSVVGWLRPIILLPASALSGLSPSQLDAVLAHELAHIRRHDFAVNALQTAAEVLLFYHPACWWMSRRIRAEREHCCDDIAVAICGDRLALAAALADLEALRQPPALALAATDGPLLRRVRRLVTPPAPGGSPAWAALAIALAVAAIVVGGVVVTRAQQAPEQARVPGMARTIAGGRGVIEGQVVEAGTGRPIAGARVDVRGSSDQVYITTDQAGRYKTRPLTPGAYGVSATAAGHTLAFYDGHAASVTGQAIEAETVSLSGPTARSSQLVIANVAARTSVSVEVRAGALVSGIDIAMQATGDLSGRILDDRGRGLAGAYIEMRAVRSAAAGAAPGVIAPGAFPGVAYAQSGDDGAYRVTAPPGDYTVRAYVPRHVRPSRDAARAYVATFYPGVPVPDAAQLVRVNAGVEQYDVDFALVSARTVRVSGTVVDPARDSLEGVRVTLRGVPSASGTPGIALDVNSRGEFDTRDVAPGTYQVMVTDPLWPSRWKAASRQIEITEDVGALEIRASAAASVTGRLVRDSRSTTTVNLSQIMVGFLVRSHDGFAPGMMLGSLDVDVDGSFRGEVPTGPIVLSVGGPPSWRVRSILVDGVESFGRPIDVTPGGHEVEVVLTDRHSSVAGAVVDRRGNPLGGFDVVFFSPDATRWYVMSPFVRQTRSHQNGRFEAASLPPGDYLAVATESVPLLMIGDPAPTLQRLQPIATRLTVRDGEHKTIAIRASPAPEGLVRFTP